MKFENAEVRFEKFLYFLLLYFVKSRDAEAIAVTLDAIDYPKLYFEYYKDLSVKRGGSKKSAELRQEQLAPRNEKIRGRVEDLQNQGKGLATAKSIVSREYKLSTRQIANIIKNPEMS